MHSHMMVDHPAPDFVLPATGNQTFSLSQARGHTGEVLEFVKTLKRTR